jgi:hypothetical protein
VEPLMSSAHQVLCSHLAMAMKKLSILADLNSPPAARAPQGDLSHA